MATINVTVDPIPDRNVQVVNANNLSVSVNNGTNLTVQVTPVPTQIIQINRGVAGISPTVTATSPIFSTGGTNPNISIQQATDIDDGYLSGTDWNTFNNKAPNVPINNLIIPNDNLNLNTHKIINLANPVNPQDAVTKSYVDSTGGGTVTSVSVVTANGLSGTVDTPTTTPAITLNIDKSGTGTTFVTTVSPTITSPILITPALGTPTVLVGTNITGTASGLTAGHVTTIPNLTGVITSVGNATSIASQTGTGTKFVVDNSPTLITPNLGTPSVLVGTNITGVATSFTSSNVTTNANLTGDVTSVGNATTVITNANLTGVITSSGNATAIASQTGTGTKFVVDTSPTLITPALGTPTALVATNATGTASALTAGAATALATARTIAGVSFDGTANIAIPLDNLSNVTIDTPTVNQILGYNGTNWANTNANTASAGTGVLFYNATPSISPVSANNDLPILTLPSIPVTTAEQTISGTAAVVTAGVFVTTAFSAFASAPLNRTIIDAGVWDFTTWINVNSNANSSVTTLTRQVYSTVPFVVGTVTITGTGTSRTATASSGTPFDVAAIDASAVNTTASYLQTPLGVYQITARTSDTVVTITTPTGYTNESAVAGTVWKKLFGVTTPEITTTPPNYIQLNTVITQPSFPITVATGIAIIGFVRSDRVRTITITYNGTNRNTHVNSPLANVHNDLAGLQGGVVDEYYHSTAAEYTGTGTGVFVRATNPILVTPALGTPSALVGTNITGTATAFTASNVTTNANLTGMVTSVGNATTVVTNANLTGGVTSLGNATTVVTNANLSGVITSVGNSTTITSQTGTGSTFVVDQSPTLTTPNLGTPSVLVGTNITGTASGLTAGTVTTNANLTGVITSVGNATSISSQTGTGSTFVVDTSPTLITPNLGTPSALVGTNITGTGASFTAGLVTDGVYLATTQTLTNKWIQPRFLASTANSATPTLNTDSYDMMVITGQSVGITSFTTNLTGTPVNGQKLWISITGTGAIAITWGASFSASTIALPTTTVTTDRLDVGFVWNVATTTWRCVASA